MKVRQKCYEGTLINSPLHRRQGIDSEIDRSQTYLHHRELSSDKLSHIELMCRRYIEASRWPQFVMSSNTQSQKTQKKEKTKRHK